MSTVTLDTCYLGLFYEEKYSLYTRLMSECRRNTKYVAGRRRKTALLGKDVWKVVKMAWFRVHFEWEVTIEKESSCFDPLVYM